MAQRASFRPSSRRWSLPARSTALTTALAFLLLAGMVGPGEPAPLRAAAQESTAPGQEPTPTTSPELALGTPVAAMPPDDALATPVPVEPTPNAEETPAPLDEPAAASGEWMIGNADGDEVRLRAEPDFSAAVLLLMPEGTGVELLDGPFTALDGSLWWNIVAFEVSGFVVNDYLIGPTELATPEAPPTEEPTVIAPEAAAAPEPDALEEPFDGDGTGGLSARSMDDGFVSASEIIEACAPGPGIPLNACVYNGEDVSGADFSGSDLTAATFNGATAVRVLFTNANLTSATFPGANLRGSTFDDADLTSTVFDGANLTGATFVGADVFPSTTWGASTTCPDGTLSGANANSCVGHLEPGSLSITNPLATDFTNVAIIGVEQTTTATLETFSVSDLRGSGAGWHVTAQATQFTATGPTLATGSLTMSHTGASAAEGTISPLPTTVAGPYLLDGGVVQVASAELDAGMGIYVFNETELELTIPAEVYAGVYVSTVTISVVSGP